MNLAARGVSAAYLLAFLCLVLTTAIGSAAENEKLSLKLNLKKGDVHKLNYKFKLELIDDHNVSLVRNDMDVDLTFTVVGIDDKGNYQVEIAFDRLKWFSVLSKSTHDSQAPKGSKLNNSRVADALFSFPLIRTVAPSGEFLAAPSGESFGSAKPKGQDKLWEAIQSELKKANAARDKSGPRPDSSFDVADCGELIIFFDQFIGGMTFIQSPREPVGPGDTWTTKWTDPTWSETARPGGGNNVFTLKYAFRSRDKEAVNLDVLVINPDDARYPLSLTVDGGTNWPKRSELSVDKKNEGLGTHWLTKLVIEAKD